MQHDNYKGPAIKVSNFRVWDPISEQHGVEGGSGDMDLIVGLQNVYMPSYYRLELALVAGDTKVEDVEDDQLIVVASSETESDGDVDETP